VKKTANKASSAETNLADSEASSQREGEQSGARELERNGQFPVVGIGASPDSLEAFRKMLDHLPAGTGMAIVLVLPLADTSVNIQEDLLSLSTGMLVTEGRDGTVVRPDHIYVIQSQFKVAIAEGVLRVVPRELGNGRHRPIDYFLRTLARDRRHRAIGVILSGTDSDGALGLEAIKIAGGITFAQDAGSEKFDSMANGAIAASHVDLVLTPEGIARELARISRHPYITPLRKEAQSAGRHSVRKILSLLQKAKGIDFTYYKANTLHRRIARRIVLNKLDGIADYAQFLRAQAAEVEALYQDILINVTRFFRNPETFVVLKERIFPLIVKRCAPDATIRIWTPGCSTGEEAYSIAISFAEFAAEQPERISVQIFATDLNDKGIEKARTGFYSKEIAKDVSPERLSRFFTEAEGGYFVSQTIRDMVVFAKQNVLSDPPFSRVDLISCRNLLIYLEPVLQKQVLPTLHYSLKPAGILWLGTSETVGSTTGMFTPLDKKHRFYSKKTAAARLIDKAISGETAYQNAAAAQKANYAGMGVRNEHAVRREADRVLLARYSPASVIINADMEIVQYRGSASAYFEPTSGKATLHLLKMASESLMTLLNKMIQQAKTDDAVVRKEGIRIKSDGVSRIINLEVTPIKGRTANERCFLVVFEPASEQNPGEAIKPRAARTGRTTGRNAGREKELDRLQQELAATREYIQSLVERQKAANDELQSANREIQSKNEELQRLNEELETAREELASGNEKLASLNAELNNRNLELSVLNTDLNNLQSLVEQHQAANDELQSANREIQSKNEELQSLNEELETAREELASGDEKLASLSAELNNRNLELSVLNTDLHNLQSFVEQHQAANDELQSANREIQSRNAELQRFNEELVTAREELESGNKKLASLNAELNNRNTELSVLNDDLRNLLGSVNIPILMLGTDMRIRRFTPQAEKLLSLNVADVGKLLGDIKLKIGPPDLQELVSEAISTASVKEREVQDKHGRWYSMHIRPYVTPDNKIEGAVIVLIDIDDLKTFAEAIVKTIHEPLIVLDENQRVRTANRAFYETFNLSPEETHNRFIYELSDRQWEIPKLRTLLEETLPRNNHLQNIEVEHEFENIGMRTMRLNARRLQQLNGRAPLNLLVIEDITERKQTKALRESEDRYRTLFRSVPVAVFVSDRNSIIQHFNPRAVELWGREPVSGVDHYSSIKFYLRDGTQLPRAQTPIAEVLRTGISANNVEISVERPDGSRISVIASFAALKGARGEIAGAVTTFEDITEIERVREAVRQSAERLRFMADSMPQKIFTARPNGELDYCNRQWMEFTGHSFEEIKNLGWTQFIHPDDVDENTRRWQHSLDTGEPFQIEHRFRRADGEYRWHLSRAHAMRDAKGKVLMWISSNTEIDDMKRAEEERNHLLACERAARADAEDANRTKDEFIATVSHELRTPLNAMLGWVQIMRAGQLNELEVAQALEAVERNAKVQNQLIADLLDTSRIVMGKLRFEMRPVELFPVIEAALETVRPAAEAKGVKLMLKLDPMAGMVMGDADRLQQIVWNLLANSIKYTPQGGHVETRLLSEEKTVSIIVRDTGEGISPEFLPHVFARFQQEDVATTRQHGGLGLGLAIVRHLVEAHGGQVSASSEGTGQGSTFAVTLPLMALSNTDFELRNKDTIGQSAILTGLRVLVVDDSSDARALLRMALTHRGAEVRIGDSARAALDILKQWRADVLVSDIGMPDEDGYDLIRQIRSLPIDRGGNIPAVALTGYASERDSARVLAAGYQMFVPKPIDLEELVGTIASVIEHDGIRTS
jgi:two-component system, chemotaxis family, CheB/CheR fusion protein